jgi:hypothetical protein
MSRPAPPALTVRYEGSTCTFAPGNDVVVGRDMRADVRVAHALVSREHLVLRFDDGRWVAIDDGSLNGMYVDGRRVSAVDIQDGMQIKLADPQGPVLTFEVGRQTCSAGTRGCRIAPRAAPVRSNRLRLQRSYCRRFTHRPRRTRGRRTHRAPGPPIHRGRSPTTRVSLMRTGRTQASRTVRARCRSRSPRRLSNGRHRWRRWPRRTRARATSRRAC